MLNEFMTALGISVGAMFPIINPVGHAPMFYAMTQDDTPAFRRRMASKTSLYTFLILLVSLLLGNTILRFFGITIDDLRIAGGLLVARTAWGRSTEPHSRPSNTGNRRGTRRAGGEEHASSSLKNGPGTSAYHDLYHRGHRGHRAGDEEFPTICGTGTEDYFCGSYNFENTETKRYQEFTTPYAGFSQVIRPDGLVFAGDRIVAASLSGVKLFTSR